MKKRLISLLVALCMAVTLLPVSAITAWAEGGGQLKIVNGYPEGSRDSNGTYTISCSGDGWSYDGSTQTLTLDPLTPTTYDLKGHGSIRQDYSIILCSAIIGENATIENGDFGGHSKSWFQYYQSWHYNEWRLLNARYKSWYNYRRHV